MKQTQQKQTYQRMTNDSVTLTITPKDGETVQEFQLKGWLFRREVWGRDVWRIFHGFLFKYPREPTQEDKARWLTFILNLPFYLPCGECSVNLVQEMQALPPTEEVMANTDSLAHWGVELHNSVNKRLNKPLITFKDAIDFYFFDAERDLSKTSVAATPSPFQTVVDSINNPISHTQIAVLVTMLIVGFVILRMSCRK